MKILYNALIIVLISGIILSCKDFPKDIQSMRKLQEILVKKYETKDINVKMSNGKYIAVSFVNSKFDKLESDAKQKMAYEVGEIVLKVMDKESKIETGRLLFVESHNYVVASSSKSVGFDMRLDSLAKKAIK